MDPSRYGLTQDELDLDVALRMTDEILPASAGTIRPRSLYEAAGNARRKLGREVRASGSLAIWRTDFVSFLCRKLPGAEDTDLRAAILVSIARSQQRALENLTQAMRAVQANPDELVVGNRMHGPVRGGYGIACLFLPGTRRPLGDVEPSQSRPSPSTDEPAPGTRGPVA